MLLKSSFILFLMVVFSCSAGANENQKSEALFESIFQKNLERSPLFQTSLGMKTNYDKWDDISEAFELETQQLNKANLKKLHALKKAQLSEKNVLNYQLMENRLEADIAFYPWRHYNYPVNQMYGWHSTIPSLLINQHRIDNKSDAEAYIGRINAIPVLIDQLIEGLKIRANKNIIAPKFVFPLVISDSRNVITGKPFNKGDDSVLYADFNKKLQTLNLPKEQAAPLQEKFKVALQQSLAPAYKKLIGYLQALEKKADTRAGAWKFPKGQDFYNAALKRTTTTTLTSDEIHQIGLDEVARIHNAMRVIMKQVKFEGDLQQFFNFMRNDRQFYYSANEAGRARYMKEATVLIDEMKANLDQYFITKPKADLTVKRVEAFREQSAGKAFYQPSAIDGSRPAYYYANLFNMKEMPTYQMAALAYHEGIPGHHMQLSIAQELEGVPQFRKFERYTAYTEGWGLYAELLPKEMGFYTDPYSDFGRLALELWRACRLVTDTGLHAKKWTREQAIDYLVKNTPNVERDSVRAIERYIVMPSQATAYKIGMLKILELRAKAKKQLGSKFDIREFHEQILKAGAIPLNILEQRIMLWVAQVKDTGKLEVKG